MILKRFRLTACLFFAALDTSCNHSAKRSDGVVRISYTHWGCFGSCPAFTVEVDRSGRGTFFGKAFTAVTGKRAFSVTPQQFQSFAAALQPGLHIAKAFDPNKSLQEQIDADFASWCPPSAPQHTDDTGVVVIWSGRENKYLDAYFGCYPDRNRKLYIALNDAPSMLGLKNMISAPELPSK